MGRKSDDEIRGMKKASLLTKLGGAAGALAAIFGLISQVGPLILNWVLADRDQRLQTAEGKLAACMSKVGSLEAFDDAALDAAEKRFQDNEVYSIQISAGLESLRNEVRIRHNEVPQTAFASTGSGLVFGNGSGGRRPTRQAVLSDIKNVSDARLSEARASKPSPQKSLKKMIAAGEKPSDDPLAGLDL
jgi:hypothetical protein